MNKIKATLPRGFIDQDSYEIRLEEKIKKIISDTYDLYGFEPLKTPMFEHSVALGKFLPDADRPNAGVFSIQDDDEQWMSLRYDLTAPMARYVAQNYETLVKPFKTYRCGEVFRNEKAGPGRFRQFIQFDADIVGAASLSADVQICMMAADVLENLSIPRGQYIIQLNNRKVLDGLLEAINLGGDENAEKRLQVLRSVDKFDKFGREGVELLLGKGRLDESGDFTKGVNLEPQAIERLLSLLDYDKNLTSCELLDKLEASVSDSPLSLEGIAELRFMLSLIEKNGYQDRIKIDTSVVRGLEYYTGPVFEAQLLFDVLNENGQKVVFGAVAGGGRYDNLVSRFLPTEVPATGFSIGVSRLMVAMRAIEHGIHQDRMGPVLILKMDKDEDALASYFKIAADLRKHGIACEIYDGKSGMKAQMKYADRRFAPCVIIQGSREREEGTVQIKDLIEGSKLAKTIDDNQTWRETRPAQIAVAYKDIINSVQQIIAKYK